jgi:hypothetical protein
MGQPKSIWGRELCQELTRWRRRTPLSLESTLPCLGQLGGAFTALRSGRQSAYAEDSERGLLLVIRLEPPAILGPPPGLLHRAGAHATLRPTGKAPSLLLGTLFTRAASRRRATSLSTCTLRAHQFSPPAVASSILAVRHLLPINNSVSQGHTTTAMSDAAHNAASSDNEVDDVATPAANEEVEAPRDTVEEEGLDDDDDLFGDGGDDAEEPA